MAMVYLNISNNKPFVVLNQKVYIIQNIPQNGWEIKESKQVHCPHFISSVKVNFLSCLNVVKYLLVPETNNSSTTNKFNG